MNQDFQLKLQAYVDGELAELETREVEAALAADTEAQALLTELRNTSGALTGFEAEFKLPETREFFWSKVEREIHRVENRPAVVVRASGPWWRRILVPAGAFAGVVVVGLVGFRTIWPVRETPVAVVETFSMDSGAMTYRDDAEGLTLVWLSYPAENEIAEFK